MSALLTMKFYNNIKDVQMGYINGNIGTSTNDHANNQLPLNNLISWAFMVPDSLRSRTI